MPVGADPAVLPPPHAIRGDMTLILDAGGISALVGQRARLAELRSDGAACGRRRSRRSSWPKRSPVTDAIVAAYATSARSRWSTTDPADLTALRGTYLTSHHRRSELTEETGIAVRYSHSRPMQVRTRHRSGGAGNRTRVLRRFTRASPCAVRCASTRIHRSCGRAGVTIPVAVWCSRPPRDRADG